jgi:2-polyprenyl-3-methyl-5-hydroxy-6-metoxy-1,4-benzoquinol methylase
MGEAATATDAPLAAGACPYAHKRDPWSSHAKIAALLRTLPPGARVLDVGAASGTLGQDLRGSGLVLLGIEPNEEWAELARAHYASVAAFGLDDAPEQILRGQDAIVLADVLEHLPDPERSLQRLVGLQEPGTLFLISVPNVANLWVRLNLLVGQFSYSERGILDRTHLRFFTRRTLLEMVSSSGLATIGVQSTPIPLGLVFPALLDAWWGRGLLRCLDLVTSLRPTLFGYQFLVTARKHEGARVSDVGHAGERRSAAAP